MPRTKKQAKKSKGKKGGKKGGRGKASTKTAPASGGVAVRFLLLTYLNHTIAKKENEMETRYRGHEKDQKVPKQYCYPASESTLPETGP